MTSSLVEMCAGIAESHNEVHKDGGDYQNCGLAIATEIRALTTQPTSRSCLQCGGKIAPTARSVIATERDGTKTEVLKASLRCEECDEQDEYLFQRIAELSAQPTLQQAIEKVKELRDARKGWASANEVGALNDALTALESLAGTQPDGGWLPIKSVPKDGTRVLLGHNENVWQDEWWKGDGTNSGWSSLVSWKESTGRTAQQPTHWMPLPQPPKDVNRKQ